ncbi:MAG: HAD family hydrolase [Deltaproteobacteria bacterium]|nr:HAD family hydrolase [Deltaproteobacteria bacterium]
MAQAVVFLDRDGTINEDFGYIGNPEDVILFDGAASAIKRLNSRGIKVIVVTNQSGVGRGYFSREALDGVNLRLKELLRLEGASIDGIYSCPHLPEEGCSCRKPGTGLVERAVTEHTLAGARSYVVGDKACDMELAAKVGARGVLVLTGHGHGELEKLACQIDFLADDLKSAVEWIMDDMEKEKPLNAKTLR